MISGSLFVLFVFIVFCRQTNAAERANKVSSVKLQALELRKSGWLTKQGAGHHGQSNWKGLY